MTRRSFAKNLRESESDVQLINLSKKKEFLKRNSEFTDKYKLRKINCKPTGIRNAILFNISKKSVYRMYP
jgi:hypothetical protein